MQNHQTPEDKTKPPIFTSDKAPAFETPAQKVLREWEQEMHQVLMAW